MGDCDMNITWAFYSLHRNFKHAHKHCLWAPQMDTLLTTFLNSQQDKSDHLQCCSRCTAMYMISKTNDQHDIWETIITWPTWTWHFLCDKMNATKKEQGCWIVCHYVWKRNFMIFVPNNFSISISFSTFMAPKQPFTNNEFAIFHSLMQ